MSKFQIILTGVFGAFILIGVLFFAFAHSSNTSTTARVTVWGTMDSALFSDFLKEANLANNKQTTIIYVQKPKATFDQDFIEGLASGKGPDLFFLPQDEILKQQNKIFLIPFSSYPERDYKNNFVQEGELYLTADGTYGLPFLVDPLVMYWNRDMFTNAGLSVPPKFWSEFYDLASKLTVKDQNFNISKSAFALGEYANVTNANEILSLLILQAGNPITARHTFDNGIDNKFADRMNKTVAPTESALNFYTEFADPLKPFYSWNRSMPESKKAFLAGDLAVYFGFASELPEIRLKNPNLNFDVAPVPQVQDAGRVTTYGRMVALAIPKTSQNIAAAFTAAANMTDTTSQQALVKVLGLPPVRRELLANKPAEAFLSSFYAGAIQARSWLSPDPSTLSPIFRDMVESVTSGRMSISQVVGKTAQSLDAVLSNLMNQ